MLKRHVCAYHPAYELFVAVTTISSESRLGVPDSVKTAEKDDPTATSVGIDGDTQSSGATGKVKVVCEMTHVLPPAPLTVIVSVPPVDVAVGLNGT